MKETLLLEIDAYVSEFGHFGELMADFEERLDDDPNEGQCEEHMDEFGNCELSADVMDELRKLANQTA